MNSIELALLQLVQIAEAPVYSAYRWLGRQLGHDLSMSEFLRLLEPLVDHDVLRLWAVASATQERSRWTEIPADLDEWYAEIPDADDSFDPYGLSFTLGSAADLYARPDWEIDLDFRAQHFVLTAQPNAAAVALTEIRRLFPDSEFVEGVHDVGGDRIRVTGSIRARGPKV